MFHDMDERWERQNWSEGLQFVQLMQNRAHLDGIKLSPYKSMFGSDIKVDLTSSSLPKDVKLIVIEGIETEKNLEKIICDIQNKKAIVEDNNFINAENKEVAENICKVCSEDSLVDGTCKLCGRK